MKKNYYRTVVDCPDGKRIVEKWRQATEDGFGEAAVIDAINNTLSGDIPFFRVTTRKDSIEIIPRSVLQTSHIRIEYSRFGI